jgi:hypothetical protein
MTNSVQKVGRAPKCWVAQTDESDTGSRFHDFINVYPNTTILTNIRDRREEMKKQAVNGQLSGPLGNTTVKNIGLVLTTPSRYTLSTTTTTPTKHDEMSINPVDSVGIDNDETIRDGDGQLDDGDARPPATNGTFVTQNTSEHRWRRM